MLKIGRSLMFLFLLAAAGQSMTLAEFTNLMRQQLAREYRLNIGDVELEIIHPEQLPLDKYTSNLQIFWGSAPLQPGIRKVWLVYQPARERQERRPCYLRIALWQEVLVAATDLRVNEILSPEKVNLKRVLLTNANDTYLTNKQQIEQKMSKQRVMAGEILTPHMIKVIPDVMLGSPVKVKITYGNIVIETEGRVNQEARIGESVTVVCDFMRRKLPGVLVSPELVQVQIR